MALPKYAAGHPKEKLVHIFCVGACKSKRYGLLNKDHAGTGHIENDPERFVTCLKCGHKQFDAADWNYL
jgi:hypothetical protein